MNWIYASGFLLPKDYLKKHETCAPSVKDSEKSQFIGAPAEGLVVEHGSCLRQSVVLAPSTKVINLDLDSDFLNEEQEAEMIRDFSIKTSAPTPLDTLALSKIYAVANFLKMEDLLNELIKLLSQRLGYDKNTPGQALTYAFERCGADSPLRRLLIDFTARTAPTSHVLDDPTFDATPELWRTLVRELATARGADVLNADQWAEHFEATLGEYRL